MKKIRITALFLAFCLMISFSAMAANEVRVMLDDEYINFDVEPMIIDGRTMVPLRAIFEAMGAEVYWDAETETIMAATEETVIIGEIGKKELYINEEVSKMDIAPVIKDGRTLVPVRFISEAFGCDVAWDNDERTVYIRTGFVKYDDNLDVGQ